MISKTTQDAINGQIKKELESAYLYLSMSAYCESANLGGFAQWLRMQAQEEVSHGMRLFDYLHNRGGQAVLQAIAQPPSEFKSVLELVQMVYEHERKVTQSIHKLYEITLKENDYASQIEVQWFVTEQVEEEKTSSDILEQLKMIGDNKSALMMMDARMATRTATAH